LAMPAPMRLAPVCRLHGHEERVWYVAWRPGAQPPELASCGSDRVVRLWGPHGGSPTAEEAWELRNEIDASDQHQRTLRSLAWSNNGEVLAVTRFDATCSLWQQDPGEGPGRPFKCKGIVTGHENEVKSAVFSPSGEYFATCSRDKSVWIYATDCRFEYECVALLQSHTQDVKMLRWHPSQDVLFSCSYDDTVKVWAPDGDDWCCKETLTDHSSTVWAISFDAEGARFATCSDDRTIRIWAPASELGGRGQTEASPASHPKQPVASRVVSASFVTPLFRGATGLAAAGVALPVAEAVASAPTGSDVATTTWRAPTDAACSWQCAAAIEGYHPRPIYSVDWLPSQATPTIASACGDNRVRVFQAGASTGGKETWACVAEIDAHTGDANCVAWHVLPDGVALLASAGDDAEVAVWTFGK